MMISSPAADPPPDLLNIMWSSQHSNQVGGFDEQCVRTLNIALKVLEGCFLNSKVFLIKQNKTKVY